MGPPYSPASEPSTEWPLSLPSLPIPLALLPPVGHRCVCEPVPNAGLPHCVYVPVTVCVVVVPSCSGKEKEKKNRKPVCLGCVKANEKTSVPIPAE